MAKMYRTAYTVSYESEDHWSVLTQMTGSVWPSVLPYCIFNVVILILLTILDRTTTVEDRWFKIEMTQQGHGFVSLVVAFLLVSRVNIAMARYSSARNGIGTMFRQVRELCQETIVFSCYGAGEGKNADAAAKGWRNEVVYRALVLLRTAMAVIDFPTTEVPADQVPELTGEEAKYVQSLPAERRYALSARNEWGATMRVPQRLAFLLRKSIASQSLCLQQPISLPKEMKLLGHVNGFVGGYNGLKQFLTTPVPFPLIQMARTFLVLYVFTIPFVMVSDDSTLAAHCFVVFVLTFGFVGLEMVAIELDNPFGDDANDFDNNALAKTAYEDCCSLIHKVDGQLWADNLCYKMHQKKMENVIYPQEQKWLVDKLKGQ